MPSRLLSSRCFIQISREPSPHSSSARLSIPSLNPRALLDTRRISQRSFYAILGIARTLYDVYSADADVLASQANTARGCLCLHTCQARLLG